MTRGNPRDTPTRRRGCCPSHDPATLRITELRLDARSQTAAVWCMSPKSMTPVTSPASSTRTLVKVTSACSIWPAGVATRSRVGPIRSNVSWQQLHAASGSATCWQLGRQTPGRAGCPRRGYARPPGWKKPASAWLVRAVMAPIWVASAGADGVALDGCAWQHGDDSGQMLAAVLTVDPTGECTLAVTDQSWDRQGRVGHGRCAPSPRPPSSITAGSSAELDTLSTKARGPVCT